MGLSQATIATSAGAGALTCLCQSHPQQPNEPLVSYQLSLVSLVLLICTLARAQ